jgi:hypothetical protein
MADGITLQHNMIDAGPLEVPGHRKACLPGADNDDVVMLGHPVASSTG